MIQLDRQLESKDCKASLASLDCHIAMQLLDDRLAARESHADVEVFNVVDVLLVLQL